jgi:hypothetical protein
VRLLCKRVIKASAITSIIILLTLSGAVFQQGPFLNSLNSSAISSIPSSILNDPYANLSAYDSYMQSFYKSSLGCFTAYPISEPSGGDYYNCWMDDAGKLLSAFTQLDDTSYASKAASFIIDNSINYNGFIYLPERTVNYSSLTYLHVNKTQLASRNFPITYTPVVNPSFESENSSKVNGICVCQPISWNPFTSGSGASKLFDNPLLDKDGSWFTQTNTNGANVAGYSQTMNIPNQITVYAHNDPSVGENSGIIGNYTASYLSTGSTATDSSVTSSSQMVWSYVSYPPFPYDTVFPGNSSFALTTYVSANQALSGVTYGVQVNEVCNGYSQETSPWGGEVTSTVNVGTTPTAFTADVSTGTSNFVFAAGCALHLIVYLNPNQSGTYTFNVYYDSKTYETHVLVPFLPTVSRIDNATSSLGFSVNALSGSSGFFFALITTDGSELLTSGSVAQSDVPKLISPVFTSTFTPNVNGNYTTFNYNGASLLNSLNPDGIIKYIEFGADSSSGNVSARWDDVYYIVNIGQGDSPAPAPNQWMTAGYYYATNGIVGLSNASDFQDQSVYEQSMAAAVSVADENATTLGFVQHPSVAQALGSSPFISDFFLWDSDNNGSGIMSRQILPYSINVGVVPYRLYLSGGNGSNINIDFWIGVNEYRNVYVWINDTIAPGQDYLAPTMTMYNLGTSAIQLNDLNLGLGSFDLFMRYNPFWSYLQLSNGTTIQLTHGFNDTSQNINSTIYLSSSSEYGGMTPTAMLWTGFRTPEFADGLLMKPGDPSNVEEIDYVYNFFGHSLRVVFNANGVVISPGGKSNSYAMQFTPTAKTDWTEPKALLYAFLNKALTTPGIDISMPGTWGFDTYGLTLFGQETNNATVLNFAKELWNSQYGNVIQRLHPGPTTYNPGSQPVIYYRSLFLFGLTGLILFPNNSTSLNIAEEIATYAVQDQLTSFGLSFGLEEDGWAVNMLGALYSETGNPEYQTYMQDIMSGFDTNTTYVAQTLSSWPVFTPAYNALGDSVWNLNSTGGVNAWCNYPNVVFRCGEMTYGLSSANPSLYWNSLPALVSASLIWESTNPQHSGLAIDARYPDNSGNSNTETQPVDILGLMQWMDAMQSTTGTFISSLHGAGLTSIQYNTYQPNKFNSLIISLSVPSEKTANMTVNYQGRGGPPIAIYDDGVQIFNYQLNKSSDDVVLTDVASQIMLLWPSTGGGKNPQACVASTSPTIASPMIRAQIGTTSTAILSVSNSQNNVSETIQGITYDPPSGIQIFTTSGIPLSMQPFQGVGTFEIQLTLNNQTKPGTFNVTAVAPFVDSCNNSGQIAFKITILAQSGPVTSSSFSWIAWLDQWWALLLVLAAVAFSMFVVWKRRQDE